MNDIYVVGKLTLLTQNFKKWEVDGVVFTIDVRENYIYRNLKRAYQKNERVQAWVSDKGTLLGFKVVSPSYNMYNNGFIKLSDL